MPQRSINRVNFRNGLLRLAGGLCLLIVAGWLVAQEPGDKAAIPIKAEQDKAQALIDDIFKEDFQRATSPEAKAKLAAFLFQQGKESGDSPANRYLLYLHTQKLAAEAGSLPLAMNAIEELNRQFKIDVLAMKAETLGTAAKTVQTSEASTELTEAALTLIAEAIEDDNYPVAKQLGEVATEAARKAKSIKLVTSVQKRVEDIDTLQQKFGQLKPFLDKLAKNPDDANANLEMGKYYGLLKGKWAKAMPLLAKGNNTELKDQAKKDLASPKEPNGQVELADGWWELAKKQDNLTKKNMQQRAAFWYTKALDRLTGLSRTKALKRIEQAGPETAIEVTGIALAPPGKVGEVRRLTGHSQEIKNIAFSPDGRFAVSGGVDNKLLLWDLKEGKQIQSFNGHSKQVWGVAFHPNGKQIASASWDASAKLWETSNGKEVRAYSHPIDVNGVAISNDGKQMLVGCDNKFMRLWDIDSGQKIRDYTGPTNYVYGVAFSPDGRLVACGSLDQSARVYDKNGGQQLKDFTQHKNAVMAVAFSPDSKHLFTCGDDAVHQYEIDSGKEVKRFSLPSSNIKTMSFSKDGRRLLTGSDDHSVRLWDVTTGMQIQTFSGHTDQVSAVALTPDGRYGLSGDYTGTLILWAMPVK